MTLLQATFIRTAVTFLVAALATAAWMLAATAFQWPLPLRIRVVQLHFLLVGFLTNMVMGVALWMFPAPPGAGRGALARATPHGWAIYALLTVGLLLRATADLALTLGPGGLYRFVVTIAAVMQVAAAFGFAMLIWQRTRARTFVRQTTSAPPELCPGPDGHELDLRQYPAILWPSAVLQAWSLVAAGERLVLVADRDPKAMVRMLHREQPGRPPYTYLESGPDRWRVQFSRSAAG